ncbi:hypothetical protein ABPG75_010295 [Micractinium tetrahymenae]
MKLFGGPATRAPEQQAILGRQQADDAEEKAAVQLASRAAQLAAKEAHLAALSETLAATEARLLAETQQREQQQKQQAVAIAGLAAAADSMQGMAAARWGCLAAQRAELAARWQCLAEERRQLNLDLQQHNRRRGGAGGEGSGDFEPGQTPMRDVTCAVVTHQLDMPFFSCCFQR